MLPDRGDRRHPRVTVADLRRDLRDADRERYVLTSSRPPRSPRTGGRLLLTLALTLAVGTLGWATRLTLGAPAAEASHIERSDAPDAAENVRSTAEEANVTLTPESASPLNAIERTRSRHRTAAAPAPAAHASHAPSKKLSRSAPPHPPTHRQTPTVRHRGPRPLSPGEFGRPHIVFGN